MKRPTRKQMYLDPRTKILLCLTVSFVMLGSENIGIMQYVQPCLAAVPLVLLVILKKPLVAAYYAMMYFFSMAVPQLLMPYLPSFVNLLFTGLIAIFTQALPAMSMFCFLILTTSVSEFMAAMDKFHISKKFTVPVSAMFRFFPTIGEEYAAICDGMRLRQVGSWRKPVEMLEYRMVPLLTGVVSIGNDLSASALTRGLNAPNRRTNMCPIGFHWPDVVAAIFCLTVLISFGLSVFMGW
ncbi:MAG: energy-coupling factor transporter transmembrane component T [Lachnospiraceae bacterium]